MSTAKTTGLNRRSVLALAATAPVSTPVAAAHPQVLSTWDLALEHYRTARRRHEAYLATVLDPIFCSAEASSPGLTPRMSDLEVEGDALCSVRHDALAVLMDLPAPCLASLGLKFRLAYTEVLQFEDGHGFIKAMLTDFQRLSGAGVA